MRWRSPRRRRRLAHARFPWPPRAPAGGTGSGVLVGVPGDARARPAHRGPARVPPGLPRPRVRRLLERGTGARGRRCAGPGRGSEAGRGLPARSRALSHGAAGARSAIVALRMFSRNIPMRQLLCVLALCVPPCALAADAGLDQRAFAQAATLREQALAGSGAFAVVESLTTEVGPRMAGSPGDAAAVAWAQAKFKALGFDRVYTQAVTFPAWRRRHERAEVLAPFPQPLHVTALGHTVGTGASPLEAEVVEFANLDALKAVADGSLGGRIAFIANRMERKKDGGGYGPAVAARGGASDAAKKGASAL